jgi:hypothetical protein
VRGWLASYRIADSGWTDIAVRGRFLPMQRRLIVSTDLRTGCTVPRGGCMFFEKGANDEDLPMVCGAQRARSRGLGHALDAN